MRQFVLILMLTFAGLAPSVLPVNAEEVAISTSPSLKEASDLNKPVWLSGWKTQTEPVQEAGYSMVYGLACCLAVLALGVWVAKRFGLVKGPNSLGGLRIIERTPLSAKTNLCLVEARGKQFLIAVGSERVSLISKISVGDSLESEQSFEEFVCDQPQLVSAC